MKYGDPLHVEKRKKENAEKRAQIVRRGPNGQTEKRERIRKNYSTNGECRVENCDSPIKARLLCETHYARLRRTGKLERTTKRIIVDTDICLAIGCEKSPYFQGLCITHSEYKRKLSTPYKTKIIKLCGVANCEERHWGKGMCKVHFDEWKTIARQHGLD